MRKEVFHNCTLYLADCREILPFVKYDVVLTDPVWPNAPAGMFNILENPLELMQSTAQLFECLRVIIVMRWDSDPRFLKAIPDKFEFLRVLNLPYNLPNYCGRTIGGMEHAYVFGEYPVAKGFNRILAGIGPSVAYKKADAHPCPRPQAHFDWLVSKWMRPDEIIIDPFMGSGTTGAAAAKFGRKFIGVEIEEKYFDEACRKIEAASKQINMFEGEPICSVVLAG